MPTLVYGPDAFTVGADVNLATYAANWSKVSAMGATGLLKAVAASDDVRQTVVGDKAGYRWTGTTLLDQSIKGKITTSSSDYPAVAARLDANGNCYFVEWQATEGVIQLYRATLNFTFIAPIASAGTVINNGTYLNAFIKVTGISPCHVEFGDDTNGTFTYDDSTSERLQSGQPGLSFYDDSGSQVSIDDLSIFDEAGISADSAARQRPLPESRLLLRCRPFTGELGRLAGRGNPLREIRYEPQISSAPIDFPVLVDVTSTFDPSLVDVSALARTIAVASTFTAFVSRAIDRTIAVASTFSPAVVKVAARNKTIAATSAFNAALSKGHARTIAVATTLTAAMTAVKSYFRTIAATTTLSASIARSSAYLRTIGATSAFTASVVKQAVRARTIAASSTFTAAISRGIGRSIAVTSSFVPLMLKGRARVIAVSSSFAASVVRSAAYQRTLAVTSTFTAFISRGSLKTIAATSTFTANIAKVFSYGRTIAATTTLTAAISRSAARLRTIAATSTFGVGFSRGIGRIIAVSSTFAPNLIKQAVRSRLIAIASSFTPNVIRQAVRSRTIAVTSAFVPALAEVKAAFRTIAVSSVFVASVGFVLRLPLKVIRVVWEYLGVRFRASTANRSRVSMESESSAKIAARSENRAATQADSDTSSTRSIERDP